MNFEGKDHKEGDTVTRTDSATGDIGEKREYGQGLRQMRLT